MQNYVNHYNEHSKNKRVLNIQIKIVCHSKNKNHSDSFISGLYIFSKSMLIAFMYCKVEKDIAAPNQISTIQNDTIIQSYAKKGNYFLQVKLI